MKIEKNKYNYKVRNSFFSNLVKDTKRSCTLSSTKAQLTIFIITGIVVFITISFFLFFILNTAEKKAQQQTTTTPKLALRIQSIKEAITNCLTLTTQQAITLLGMQGGHLYQNQGGSSPDIANTQYEIDYLDYDNHRVHYLIYEPQGHINTLFSTTPPDYPWQIFPYLDETYQSTQVTGYYGKNTLPGLYKPAKNSIQEQIEMYITNNLPTCIPFTTYHAQGLAFTYKLPITTLLLANATSQLSTETTLHITTNWPITITEKTTNNQATLTELSTTLTFPLARIYYTINSILNNDAQNITYEPHSTQFYHTTITPVNKDSIITTTFPAVILNNQPYQFRFTRHTRNPALHYLPQLKKIKLPVSAEIKISQNQLTITKTTCEGNPLTLSLFAYDPDGTTNNENIQFATLPENPVFTEPTPLAFPKEIRLITQKKNNLQKQDWQTIFVTVYPCPTP